MRLSLRLQSACVKAPSIRPFLCGIFVYACVLIFVGNADSIRFNVLKKEERCLFSFSDAKAHVVIGAAVVAADVAQLISIFFYLSSSTNTCRTIQLIYDARCIVLH